MSKIAERSGFEIYHRQKDSGVYADNFTVAYGKDHRWQLGTNGSEMADTPSDRDLREKFPKAYAWAVERIKEFLLKRAHEMLAEKPDPRDGDAPWDAELNARSG